MTRATAPFVLGVVGVESFRNEHRVIVVLRKDNGLSKPVSFSHRPAAGHQMFQNPVYGVLVENNVVAGYIRNGPLKCQD